MGCVCNTFTLTVIAALGATACYDADPRDVRGALDAAARAIEADDGRALYRVIDQRSRHALESIVKSRHQAAALIREHYPPPDRAAALAELGDAARARDAAALFAERCARACRARIEQGLGAPVAQRRDGDEVVVTTAQGGRVRLYRGSDTWYGLVYRTGELDRERARAAQELSQIRANVETYRRRRELTTGSVRSDSEGESGQPPSGRSR